MKDCSWLFGSNGFKRLEQLAVVVKSQYESHASERYGVHSKFHPVMSFDFVGRRSKETKQFLYDYASNSADLVESNVDVRISLSKLLGEKSAPFFYADQNITWLSIDMSPDIKEWSSEIQKSITLLRSSSESIASKFDLLVKKITPVRSFNGHLLRPMGSGLSAHWYIGGLFMGMPIDFPHRTVELAINLAHELGHQALMIYQQADSIIEGNLEAEVYSAIRRTNRPAILSFHAAVALGFMAEFILAVPESCKEGRRYVLSRRAEISDSLTIALSALKDVKLTALGKEIFLDLRKVSAHLKAS